MRPGFLGRNHSNSIQKLTVFLKAPKSLVLVLEALGETRIPQILWLGAISINQKQMDDKSQQVPRMSRIYSIARPVCVWLRPESTDSKTVFHVIRIAF
jgi:hypothetical protein